MVTGVTDLPADRIEAFSRRWKIASLWVFGSILRDDFGPQSDVDVMVEFEPDADPSLFDHVAMRDELREIVGRPIDLVTRRAVEASRNPIRRRAILDNARAVYVA